MKSSRKDKPLAVGRFVVYVTRRYWRDEALDLASSLAYTSLVSLVPLMAIGLAILTAFPRFEALRQDLLDTVFRTLVPEVGAQVQAYVGRFAANAGKLTVVGVVGLVATAVTMLVSIEAALNRIFRVPQMRAPWSRLVVYWGTLTVGPLLAGVSLTLTTWFSVLHWVRFMHLWAGRDATAEVRALLGAITPFVIMTAAFAILFFVAPNRRVKTRDALTGAIVASLLLVLLRQGFSLYVALWGQYRSVYGAVAAIPIFLVWVYLSWTSVLFGAEIAAALPEWRTGRRDLDGPFTPRRQLGIALSILEVLAARESSTALLADLADAAHEGERVTAQIARQLAAAKLTRRHSGRRFALGGAFASASLADVLKALSLGSASLEAGASPTPVTRADALLAAAARSEAAALKTPLHELLALTD